MSDEDYDQGFVEGYYHGLSTDKETSFLILAARKETSFLILAARIEELKKENEKLRAALKPFAEMITEIEDYWEDHYRVEACNGLIAGEIRAAAAALKETE